MRFAASLLAFVGVVAACHDSRVGPEQGSLRLTVAVAPSVLTVGDTTSVLMRLRNLGSDSVTLTVGGCEILPYIVAEPSGNVVYPGGGHWYCIASIGRLTLGPGAEKTQTLIVRGVAAPVATDPGASIGPGQYLIYATLNSPQFPLRAESVPLAVQ